MRGKEEAHDYRYFPDPDLLPLVIDQAWIDQTKKTMPELPDAIKTRFIKDLGLPVYDAEVLTSDRALADYYEQCVNAFPDAKQVSNWVMGNLLGLLKAQAKTIDQSPIGPQDLARLLKLIDQGVISGKIAKTVFDDMADSGKPPQVIVEEKGLVQVTDTSLIQDAVEQVLQQFPQEVAAYQNGKTKLLGFFVGQVMRATKGKANPKMVNEVLKSKLG